jgi:uncharacterized MAPEG superfamily protein
MLTALSPLQVGLIYLIWTMLLLLSFGLQRVYLVLTGQKTAHDFPAGVPHGAPLYWRLNRAHMNAIENFPFFIILIFASYIVEVSQEGNIRTAFTLALIARFLQSLFHALSYRGLWINFRFAAYITQIGLFLYLTFCFLSTESVLR